MEQPGKSPIEKLEKFLGLPPLSQLGEALEKFPDIQQLKLIKEVLDKAERIAGTGVVAQLGNVSDIIKEINSMPLEKLKELERVLKRFEKIMKTAPGELTQFLRSLKEK